MTKEQENTYDVLSELTGQQVANLFIDYLGLQVLDAGFIEHIAEEGYK